MRKLRFRPTIRALMIVVAIAGLFLGGGIEAARLSNLSREYRQAAQECYKLRQVWIRFLQAFEKCSKADEEPLARLEKHPDMVDFVAKARAHNRDQIQSSRMAIEELTDYEQKYRRAARFPWLPVPPDPPPGP